MKDKDKRERESETHTQTQQRLKGGRAQYERAASGVRVCVRPSFSVRPSLRDVATGAARRAVK